MGLLNGGRPSHVASRKHSNAHFFSGVIRGIRNPSRVCAEPVSRCSEGVHHSLRMVALLELDAHVRPLSPGSARETGADLSRTCPARLERQPLRVWGRSVQGWESAT